MKRLAEKRSDLFAVFVLLVFAASLSLSTQAIDSSSYPILLEAKGALAGKSASNYAAFLAGVAGASGQPLSALAVFLPPFFAGVSVLCVYLAARVYSDRFRSFICAFLLCATPAFYPALLSGVLSPDAPSLALSALALLLLAASFRLHFALALLAGIASAAAAFFSPSSLLFSLALVLSAAFQAFKEYGGKEFGKSALAAVLYAAPVAACVLAFQVSLPALSFSAPGAPVLFLAGIAVVPVALAALRAGSEENAWFALALSLVCVLLAFSSQGFPVLGLALGASLFRARDFRKSEVASSAAFLCLAFFCSLAVFLSFFPLEASRALMLSLVLTLLAGLGAWMYREKGLPVALFYSISLAAFLLLFTGVFSLQYAKQPLSPASVAEIAWLKANAPAGSVVASLDSPEAIEFESGFKALSDRSVLAKFLASGSDASGLKAAGVSLAFVNARVFDDIPGLRALANDSSLRVDSFAPTGAYYYLEQGGTLYAQFASSQGVILLHPADSDTGNLIDGDVVVQDVGYIPRSRILMLKVSNGTGFSNADRFVYPRSGFDSNLLKLFFPENNFGEVPGVRVLNRTGGMLVLGVE